jgi:hypothetical protein
MVVAGEVTVLIQQATTRSQNRGAHPGLVTRTRSSGPARTISDDELSTGRSDALCFDALYDSCFQRRRSGIGYMSPQNSSIGMHRDKRIRRYERFNDDGYLGRAGEKILHECKASLQARVIHATAADYLNVSVADDEG